MKQTREQFSKQGESLYVFKLDPQEGSIDRFEISDYNVEQVSKYAPRKLYVFKATLGALHNTLYRIDEQNIDQFKNNKVISFNDSKEHARCVMINALEQRQNELEKKQHATSAILAAILG